MCLPHWLASSYIISKSHSRIQDILHSSMWKDIFFVLAYYEIFSNYSESYMTVGEPNQRHYLRFLIYLQINQCFETYPKNILDQEYIYKYIKKISILEWVVTINFSREDLLYQCYYYCTSLIYFLIFFKKGEVVGRGQRHVPVGFRQQVIGNRVVNKWSFLQIKLNQTCLCFV